MTHSEFRQDEADQYCSFCLSHLSREQLKADFRFIAGAWVPPYELRITSEVEGEDSQAYNHARVYCDYCKKVSDPTHFLMPMLECSRMPPGVEDPEDFLHSWKCYFYAEEERGWEAHQQAAWEAAEGRAERDEEWQREFEEQEEEERRILAAPVVLGVDTRADQAVTIKPEELCAGTYVIGTQGTGKSSLLEQIALQRMTQKDSVIVLDPHNKLVDDVISRLPAGRRLDTYLIDLNDAREHPFSLNIFSCADPTNEVERARTKNRVARVFARLWPETESGIYAKKMLRYATSTLIDNPSRTLLDAHAWFEDSRLPQEFVANLRDHNTRQFWMRRPRPDQVSPFVDRIDILLEDDVLRRLLCNPEPCLDIRRIIQKRQSLLVKLPVDDDVLSYASKHVGVILFSLIYGTTFSDLPDDGSLGYTLVVDEFQNFVTNEFVKLFVGARKYGAKLLLAHQYVDQLSDEGLSSNRHGVQTAGTSISFQTTPSDARELAPLYAPLEKTWSRGNLRIDVAYRLKDHADEAVKSFAMLRVQPLIEGCRGEIHQRWETAPDPYFITGGRKVYYKANTVGQRYETTQFPTRNFGWGPEAYDPAQARAALEQLNDLLYDAQKNRYQDPTKRATFIKTLARIGKDATEDEIVSREHKLDVELQHVIPELIADPLVQDETFVARRTVMDELLALSPRDALVKTRTGVHQMTTFSLPEATSKEESSKRRKTLLQRTHDAYCRSPEQLEEATRKRHEQDVKKSQPEAQRQQGKLLKFDSTSTPARPKQQPEHPPRAADESTQPPQPRPTIGRRPPKKP